MLKTTLKCRREGKKIRYSKKKMLFLLMVLCIILFVILDIILSNSVLQVVEYEICTEKLENNIKVVHLTDLHNSEFEKNNEKLVEKIKEQKPDIVCITGDLINMHSDNTNVAANLIEKLSALFPVFISFGNHESEYQYMKKAALEKIFQDAGATVLDFTYEDIEIIGTKLRIGGFYGYGFSEDHEAAKDNESSFLKEFQDTDRYKILLAHMPFSWYHGESLDYWNIDLVLSGHTHGGQIRLPFIGGLYAPDIGWFPGRECGLYYSQNKKNVMALSRGLGSTEIIPRLNNLPEIVVIELTNGSE